MGSVKGRGWREEEEGTEMGRGKRGREGEGTWKKIYFISVYIQNFNLVEAEGTVFTCTIYSLNYEP